MSQDAELLFGVEPRRGTVLRAALEAVRGRETPPLTSDVAIALVRPQVYTTHKLQRLADRGLLKRSWPGYGKGYESRWEALPKETKTDDQTQTVT